MGVVGSWGETCIDGGIMNIFKRLFASVEAEEGTNSPHVSSLSEKTRKEAEDIFGLQFYFDEKGYKEHIDSILAYVDAGVKLDDMPPERIAAYREMSDKAGW